MPDRLLYATPTGKHPHPGYVQSVRNIEMTCHSFDRRLEDFLMAAGPVQMARTTIAEHALKGNCYVKHDHGKDPKACVYEPYDYLVMHDDDLVIDPTSPAGNPLDTWHELFRAAPDLGVIGAVYLREKLETPCVVISHDQYPEEHCHLVNGMPAQPFACAGVGTGFIMIRVAALRQLALAEDGAHALFRFPFNMTRWGIVNHTGEDYDFCARMTGAGFRVVADPRFPTTHIKESGLLRYAHAAYEQQWSPSPPAGVDEVAWQGRLRERYTALRACCAPLIDLKTINGFGCLDHVEQLKAEATQKAAKRPALAIAKGAG